MDKVFTVGIAGFGRSGCNIHSKALAALPDKFKIVAVADAMEERRKDAIDKFGCKTFEDYGKMLEDAEFDLFVDATPNRLHVEAGVAALNAGRHLLNEKPQARSLEGLESVIAAAKKARRVYYPFQNYRFKPSYLKMKEVLDSGVLGRLVSARINWSFYARRWDWQTLQSEWGGNLLNNGPHQLDHALMLFGEGEPQVFGKLAACNPSGGDAENWLLAVLHGEGKPTIEIAQSGFQAYPQGERYNFSCEFGGMAGGDKHLEWKFYDPGECPAPEMWKGWSRNREYCSEKLVWRTQSWSYDGDEFEAAPIALYKQLHATLSGKEEQLIKHEEIRRQMRVVEALRKASPRPELALRA